MRCNRLNTRLPFLILACLFLGSLPVSADEESDWIKTVKDTDLASEPAMNIENTALLSGPTGSMHKAGLNNAAAISSMNPADLRARALACLKQGEADAAIKLVERAIEMQPEDLDGRQTYAQALENKVMAQTEPDSHLFNQCLRQWYFIYKKAEYSELVKLAAGHLQELTGKSPYIWPGAKMYLSRVMLPEAAGSRADLDLTEEPAQVR